MDASARREDPAPNPFEPLIEAIAEAVVRKIEERQRIDAIAEAVLLRIRELGAGPRLLGADGAGAAGDGASPSQDDVYRIILDVLGGGGAAPEER